MGDPAHAPHVGSVLAGLATGALAGSLAMEVGFALLDQIVYPGSTSLWDLPRQLWRNLSRIPGLFGLWLVCLIVAAPAWALLHWLGARGWATAMSLGLSLSLAILAALSFLILPSHAFDATVAGVGLGLAALGAAVGPVVWLVAYRFGTRIPRLEWASLSPPSARARAIPPP